MDRDTNTSEPISGSAETFSAEGVMWKAQSAFGEIIEAACAGGARVTITIDVNPGEPAAAAE